MSVREEHKLRNHNIVSIETFLIKNWKMEAIHSDGPYIFCIAPKDSGKRPPWPTIPLSRDQTVCRLHRPYRAAARLSFFPAQHPFKAAARGPRHNCSHCCKIVEPPPSSVREFASSSLQPTAQVRLCSLCIFGAVHADSHFEGFEAEDDDFEEPSIDPASLRSPPSSTSHPIDPNPNPNPQSPPTFDLPKSPPTIAFDFWDDDEFEGIYQVSLVSLRTSLGRRI
ncbi:hypothetical protein SESBI_48622 [Sesbania bispinosa]|nr:hypothetical protein SESBI_48622 [Sesbania bispinosa]